MHLRAGWENAWAWLTKKRSPERYSLLAGMCLAFSCGHPSPLPSSFPLRFSYFAVEKMRMESEGGKTCLRQDPPYVLCLDYVASLLHEWLWSVLENAWPFFAFPQNQTFKISRERVMIILHRWLLPKKHELPAGFEHLFYNTDTFTKSILTFYKREKFAAVLIHLSLLEKKLGLCD